MIFVTVGNHYQGFDRLLRKVDEIAPRIPQEIIVQKGYTKYIPRNAKHFDFVPIQEAIQYIQTSDLVISHAGIGTIILCKEFGIPLILFPRRRKYGEHGTDHQMEIARVLEERRDEFIAVVYEEGRLENKINEFLSKNLKPVPGVNIGKLKLIKTIQEFIKEQH